MFSPSELLLELELVEGIPLDSSSAASSVAALESPVPKALLERKMHLRRRKLRQRLVAKEVHQLVFQKELQHCRQSS
jgi:hypothetical protein